MEFHEAGEQDLSAIVDLVRSEYADRFDATDDYYRHRYLRNPVVPGGLFVARDGAAVVGIVGWAALRFWDGRSNSIVGLVGDALTRQDVRHVIVREGEQVHSVFTKLHALAEAKARHRGLEFLYAFPNEHSYRSFSGRFGYEELGALHFYVRPRRSSALLRRRGLRIGPVAPVIDAVVRAGFSLVRPSMRRLSTRSLDPSSAAIDRLWARVAQLGHSFGVRDAMAVSWRFTGRPYRLIGVFDGDDLRGYVCVVDEQREGLRVRTVCDAVAARPVDLARALVAADHDDWPDAILFVCQPLEFRAGLRRAGFLDAGPTLLGKQFPIMRKRLGASPPLEAVPWYLTLADNDVV